MALFGALCVGWYHAGMQNKSDFFRLSKKTVVLGDHQSINGFF